MIAWLAELAGSARITHRVLADAGVVVVEVADPLRVQDVEALATVVDGWLTDHPSLHGLVLHARAFPGWENIGGLIKHLLVVLDHHRRIDKVALAVDGLWPVRPPPVPSTSSTLRYADSAMPTSTQQWRGRAPRSNEGDDSARTNAPSARRHR